MPPLVTGNGWNGGQAHPDFKAAPIYTLRGAWLVLRLAIHPTEIYTQLYKALGIKRHMLNRASSRHIEPFDTHVALVPEFILSAIGSIKHRGGD